MLNVKITNYEPIKNMWCTGMLDRAAIRHGGAKNYGEIVSILKLIKQDRKHAWWHQKQNIIICLMIAAMITDM